VRGLVVVGAVSIGCGRIGFELEVPDVPALVGSTVMVEPSAASVVVPIQPPVAGDLVVVATLTMNTSRVTTVVDSAGNGFASANARATSTPVSASDIWYVVVGRDGAASLTVSYDAASPSTVWVAEFSGIGAQPLDTSAATNDELATSTVAAPLVTTHAPNALVFSVTATTTVTGIDATSPFVALAPGAGDDSAYYVASDVGEYGAVWDINLAGVSCASTAAFRAGR
jgi:hypothetical protein